VANFRPAIISVLRNKINAYKALITAPGSIIKTGAHSSTILTCSLALTLWPTNADGIFGRDSYDVGILYGHSDASAEVVLAVDLDLQLP